MNPAGFVADGTPREREGKANEDAAARFEGQHLGKPMTIAIYCSLMWIQMTPL
jgi:hypothetical protein